MAHMKRFVWLFLFQLIVPQLFAQYDDWPIIEIDSFRYYDSLPRNHIMLDSGLEYLVDSTGEYSKLNFENEEFLSAFSLMDSSTSKKHQYLRPESSIYVRFQLHNSLNHPIDLLLFNQFELVSVYDFSPDGSWSVRKSGNKRPKSELDSSHLKILFPVDFLFPLSLKAQETKTLLIQYQSIYSASYPIPFPHLESEKTIVSEVTELSVKRGTFAALFGGILACMALLYFCMYGIKREYIYLYGGLYVSCLVIDCLHEFQIYFHIIFPDHYHVALIIFIICNRGYVFFCTLFCIDFNFGDGWKPRFRRWANRILWIMVLLSVIQVSGLIIMQEYSLDLMKWRFIPAQWISKIFAYTVLGITIVSWYLVFRWGSKMKKYFTLTVLFLTVGMFLSYFLNYSVDRLANPFLLPFIKYGFAVISAVLFFTFLSYRSQLIEKERNLLEGLISTKSRFFANVSHEFRTPLTLILGPVEKLLQKAPSGETHEQLTLIQRNGKRLLRFVNQILDLAKIESGQMELEPVPTELISLSRRITGAFDSVAKSKEIDLRFHSSEEELNCMVDQEKLEMVINNLISNACKFTSQKGNIAVDVRLQSKNQIHISVTDDGPGISPVHQPYIFDRFYQVENEDFTTNQPSTGIGLSLSKELVELHGGTISLKSQVGSGSTFLLLIPYIEVMEATTVVSRPEKTPVYSHYSEVQAFQTSDPLPVDQTQPMLLIVEDNKDVSRYLRICLQDTYQLIEATDGGMGISMAIDQVPDLIITDVMMPNKDGYQLTEALKSHQTTSHIPIIILTGKYSLESRLKGLGADADAYLTKPFEAEELKATIQSLLNNRNRLQFLYSQELILTQGPIESRTSTELDTREQLFLSQCQEAVNAQLSNEDFSVEDFATAVHMDRTQLFRKLKALTGQSPSRFIRTIRLRHALPLIRANTATIAEIAYSVGFGSTTYFNRVFKEEFGKAPGEFLPPKN